MAGCSALAPSWKESRLDGVHELDGNAHGAGRRGSAVGGDGSSELHGAADHLSDIPADPGLAADLLDVDPPGAPEGRALRRDVPRRREPLADEPERQAGVEAPGDRILGNAEA